MRSPLARRPRIVIADDHDDFRELVAGELSHLGYHAVHARDAGEVVSYLAASSSNPRRYPRPRAVITDVRMPGLDGLQLLAALRGSGLPVIVMTAFGDDDVYAAARRWGAAAVLDKPFALEEFRSVLEDAIGP